MSNQQYLELLCSDGTKTHYPMPAVFLMRADKDNLYKWIIEVSDVNDDECLIVYVIPEEPYKRHPLGALQASFANGYIKHIDMLAPKIGHGYTSKSGIYYGTLARIEGKKITFEDKNLSWIVDSSVLCELLANGDMMGPKGISQWIPLTGIKTNRGRTQCFQCGGQNNVYENFQFNDFICPVCNL